MELQFRFTFRQILYRLFYSAQLRCSVSHKHGRGYTNTFILLVNNFTANGLLFEVVLYQHNKTTCAILQGKRDDCKWLRT